MERKLPHLILGPEWTTTVKISEPDHCTCDITQGTWELEADGGGIGLVHSVCGKGLLSDLMETVTLDSSITVTLTPEKDDCSCWAGDCDCTVWLTMRKV